MNNDDEKSKQEYLETPIRDGDTRPDQNLDPKAKKKSSPLASSKDRVTKERGADVDRWEDYKDAKLEE
jgi:hypothetical protein